MKKLLIVVAVLVIAFFLIQYSRSDYAEFSKRREDWQRRCSAYVGSNPALADPTLTPACTREGLELLAYAEQKGWTK